MTPFWLYLERNGGAGVDGQHGVITWAETHTASVNGEQNEQVDVTERMEKPQMG